MFSIANTIHEYLKKTGLPVEGVSYSEEEDKLRIDFYEQISEEQNNTAYTTARSIIDKSDIYQAEWEQREAQKITPEKIEPLVNLLQKKGILSIDDIINL